MTVQETRLHQFPIAVITGLEILRNITEPLSLGHGLTVNPTVLVSFASSLGHWEAMLGFLVLEVGPEIKNCIGRVEFMLEWYPKSRLYWA